MERITLAVLNEKVDNILGEIREIKNSQVKMVDDKKLLDDKFHRIEIDLKEIKTTQDTCPARENYSKNSDNSRSLYIQIAGWSLMIFVFIIGKFWK